MSSRTLPANLTNFQAALAEYMGERKCTSDGLLLLGRVLVVMGTTVAVAMATAYAWKLGENPASRAVTISAAVFIEWAVVFVSAHLLPRWVLTGAKTVAAIGILSFSLLSAASFMLSQQWAAENKALTSVQAQLAADQADLAKLDISKASDRGTIRITKDRIRENQERLAEAQASGQGDGATAIYHWAGNAFGCQMETILLWVKLLWALSFVALCVALDAYLDSLYSPAEIARFAKRWDKQRAALAPYLGLDEEAYPERNTPSAPRKVREPGVQRPRPAESGDTGTEGIKGSRYERVRDAIVSGQVKPSVRAVKEFAQTNSETATKYLGKLEAEGLIPPRRAAVAA